MIRLGIALFRVWISSVMSTNGEWFASDVLNVVDLGAIYWSSVAFLLGCMAFAFNYSSSGLCMCSLLR